MTEFRITFFDPALGAHDRNVLRFFRLALGFVLLAALPALFATEPAGQLPKNLSAALEVLGPAYTWKTDAYLDGMLTAMDGTMHQRVNSSAVAGQAHIKTGYIQGVRAIAGYTLDAEGRMLAVVFIINHPAARFAQAAQDTLLEWVQAGYSRHCCGRR